MLVLPAFDNAQAEAWCAANRIAASAEPAANYPVQSLSAGDALWLPQAGQVRPPKLLKALRQWLVQHGVTLREHTQLKPLAEIDQLDSWETTDGEHLHADKFVVTSGAWSFELLRANAMKLNIKPMRGQILLYQLPHRELTNMVYREGFYLVPRKDGMLLAGSTLEDVGFDTATTDSVKQELQKKAEAILPVLKDLPVLKHWSGLRPGTPENLPTIAGHPTIKNLFLNTGHFRYGLTMAPCSADMVASLVCEQIPEHDVTAFSFPS